MNTDLTLLASAYLDDDVTSDERALVETDPAALAEVERLRVLRALVREVEPPAISVRETHLAAAFDAWERLPDQLVAPASRNRPSRNRRAQQHQRTSISTRWLTGAAAALVLVLAGGIALQLRNTDDNSASVADVEARDETGDDAANFAAVDTVERADDPAADERAPTPAATSELADGLDTAIANPAPPGETSSLDRLQNLTDLADFASAAIGAPIAPDVAAATNAPRDRSETAVSRADAELPRCFGVDLIVGPAVYGDVTVVVGIDEGRNLAIAYRAASCTEVARVRLSEAGS
jgi:hypothetical protein